MLLSKRTTVGLLNAPQVGARNRAPIEIGESGGLWGGFTRRNERAKKGAARMRRALGYTLAGSDRPRHFRIQHHGSQYPTSRFAGIDSVRIVAGEALVGSGYLRGDDLSQHAGPSGDRSEHHEGKRTPEPLHVLTVGSPDISADPEQTPGHVAEKMRGALRHEAPSGTVSGEQDRTPCPSPLVVVTEEGPEVSARTRVDLECAGRVVCRVPAAKQLQIDHGVLTSPHVLRKPPNLPEEESNIRAARRRMPELRGGPNRETAGVIEKIGRPPRSRICAVADGSRDHRVSGFMGAQTGLETSSCEGDVGSGKGNEITSRYSPSGVSGLTRIDPCRRG